MAEILILSIGHLVFFECYSIELDLAHKILLRYIAFNEVFEWRKRMVTHISTEVHTL